MRLEPRTRRWIQSRLLPRRRRRPIRKPTPGPERWPARARRRQVDPLRGPPLLQKRRRKKRSERRRVGKARTGCNSPSSNLSANPATTPPPKISSTPSTSPSPSSPRCSILTVASDSLLLFELKLARGLRLSYPYAELVVLLFPPRSRSAGDASLPAAVRGTADDATDPKLPRPTTAEDDVPPPTRDAKSPENLRETFLLRVPTADAGSEAELLGLGSTSFSTGRAMPPVREPPS